MFADEMFELSPPQSPFPFSSLSSKYVYPSRRVFAGL